MKIQDARALAKSLLDAASEAEAAGLDEIELVDSLQAADDAARQELVDAINEAKS